MYCADAGSARAATHLDIVDVVAYIVHFSARTTPSGLTVGGGVLRTVVSASADGATGATSAIIEGELEIGSQRHVQQKGQAHSQEAHAGQKKHDEERVKRWRARKEWIE